MLMVLGFVGTVVALERAVALGRVWGYGAPAGLGLGGLALLTPLPLNAGRILLVLGAAIARRGVRARCGAGSRPTPSLVQSGGAVLATGRRCCGSAACRSRRCCRGSSGSWFSPSSASGSSWPASWSWTAPRHASLVAISGAVMAGAGASLLWPAAGYPLLGAALLGSDRLADPVRRRPAHRPRQRAAALHGGLPAHRLRVARRGRRRLAARRPAVRPAAATTLVVHAVFLGFVMSMIMAHAPVILPAVLRRPLPYHPVMYLPAALLVGSLLLRTVVGDLRGRAVGLAVGGGSLNVVALLLFVGHRGVVCHDGGQATTRAERDADPRAGGSVVTRTGWHLRAGAVVVAGWWRCSSSHWRTATSPRRGGYGPPAAARRGHPLDPGVEPPLRRGAAAAARAGDPPGRGRPARRCSTPAP